MRHARRLAIEHLRVRGLAEKRVGPRRRLLGQRLLPRPRQVRDVVFLAPFPAALVGQAEALTESAASRIGRPVSGQIRDARRRALARAARRRPLRVPTRATTSRSRQHDQHEQREAMSHMSPFFLQRWPRSRRLIGQRERALLFRQPARLAAAAPRGAAPPADSSVPLANTIFWRLPTGAPFLATKIYTVTCSPIVSDFLVHPRSSITCGGSVAAVQCVTPFSSVTSK